jgi:hypothetical protein
LSPYATILPVAAKKPKTKELRLKYSAGSPLDQMVEKLKEHFGIDKPAVLQMALKRLADTTF